ncbi:inositol-pentakisphosphate 2-kinase-like, partial [Tropilaelaps mercedesae]
DSPYVIKLKKAPVATHEKRIDSSECGFGTSSGIYVSQSEKEIQFSNVTESVPGTFARFDEGSAEDYWRAMHNYQRSFIQNVAVPLLGKSLVDIPILVKLSRDEVTVLLSKSRKDRAAHRLAKAPSFNLGSALVFPDYCIFKPRLTTDLTQRQQLINGLLQGNLRMFVEGAGKSSTNETILPVPVLGPVISIEIKSKMGFLPCPPTEQKQLRSALFNDLSTLVCCPTAPSNMNCVYTKNSNKDVLATRYSCRPQNNEPRCHKTSTSSTSDEKMHIKSCICRFHLVQHQKLREGLIQHISNYCPLDLFSGCPERMESAILGLLYSPQNNLRIFRDRHQIYSGEREQTGGLEIGRYLKKMLTDFLPSHEWNHAKSSPTELQKITGINNTSFSYGDKYSSSSLINHLSRNLNDQRIVSYRNLSNFVTYKISENSILSGHHTEKKGSRSRLHSTQRIDLTAHMLSIQDTEYKILPHLCNLIRLALCLPLKEDRSPELVSGNVRLETRQCIYSTKCGCHLVECGNSQQPFSKKSGSSSESCVRTSQNVNETRARLGREICSVHEIPHGSVLCRVLQAQQLCSADVSTVHKTFFQGHRVEDFADGSYICLCIAAQFTKNKIYVRFPWPSIPPVGGLTRDEKFPHETTPQFHSRMLWKYLVALTARDCSLMLTMQKIDVNRWSGNISSSDPRLNVLEYGNERYLLQIGIVDLEPKGLDRIPKHVRDDVDMARNFSFTTF